MSPKEYLLAVLERVTPVSAIAVWLQTLVQYGDVNDEMLDGLAQIFRAMLQDAKTEADKAVLQKASRALEGLREKEKKEREQELAELDELVESL